MPRRPEIGNIQLYPDRPLRRSDRNGYVLKFYCPIAGKRVRKNCGTRDRREVRSILRECGDRLRNGEYAASGGAIIAAHETRRVPALQPANAKEGGQSWQECYERYRQHRTTRSRKKSLVNSISRIEIAERIFEKYREDRGLPEGLRVSECMTLDMMEYLQDQLLAGAEGRYETRSPNTVNSTVGSIMAFVRFCKRHGWIDEVPPLEKLPVDDVMKGRPISGEEFERMLAVTEAIVGPNAAPSWKLSLRLLWESGFRIGDLMDFHWDDDRHIYPVWSTRRGHHPTIVVPSSQKNRKAEEIPMLPGLQALLEAVPKQGRTGWVANPLCVDFDRMPNGFRPKASDLRSLVERFSNESIAAACGVSETAVRKWLTKLNVRRSAEFCQATGSVLPEEIAALRRRSQRKSSPELESPEVRLTTDHVSRIIAAIGEKANIVVRQPDKRTGVRIKYASAHDLRRGCAQRLINAGVSAETLKIVMRHRDFATTEKYYGAVRSAQSAACEIVEKFAHGCTNRALVGGLVGGLEEATKLSASEVTKLKALLERL